MGVQRERVGEAPSKPAVWNDPRIRAIVFQVLMLAAILGFFAYIMHNAALNLQRQGIASGFGFLERPAGFGIQLALIEYSELSPNMQVFWVGLLNTILVAVLGIVFATILGFVIGIARLSTNWLVARLATVYIETIRNLPVLLQILFWYYAVLGTLPQPRDSVVAGGWFLLNNRGLFVPRPIWGEGIELVVGVFVAGIVATVVYARWVRRQREATGEQAPVLLPSLGFLIGLPLLVFLATGMPLTFDVPELGRFRPSGGMTLLPELVALTVALSIYTAAFIAETVRAGILSVNKGQIEAAHALGLRPSLTLRLVVIPQAMRVIIPPLTSQYLNLTKNSSLAVAVGYPDLVAVFSGTVLNQTGQAVEVIAMTMAVYLVLSLLISLFMNWYNKKIALVER